jgi:hypothetical protein
MRIDRLALALGLFGSVTIVACASAPNDGASASSDEALVPADGGAIECFGIQTHFKPVPCPPGLVCVSQGIDVAFCEPPPVQVPCGPGDKCPPGNLCVNGTCERFPVPGPR